MSENSYCDTSLIFLKSINKNIAKNLIIKNHYTHKWTLCTVAYGVYYKEYVESTFFGGFNAKLIGDAKIERLPKALGPISEPPWNQPITLF